MAGEDRRGQTDIEWRGEAMTVAVIALATFILYPMLAGVTFRFLGRKDPLRILFWCGTNGVCPQCCAVRDFDFGADWECRHGRGYRDKENPAKRFVPQPVDRDRWIFAAMWPFVWLALFMGYTVYWLVITPAIVLSLIAASQARLAAGKHATRNTETQPTGQNKIDVAKEILRIEG